MASEIAAARSKVRTVLLAVPGISLVLEALELTEDPAFLRENFVEADGRLCGWQIAAVEDLPAEHVGYLDRRIVFTLLGFLGYKGIDSSKEAEEMLEAVVKEFRKPANRRLSGTVDWTEAPTFTAIAPRLLDFGDAKALAHRIEVRFPVVVETVNV